MRYRMLVLFLSAALYAQTPPAPAPNQQSDKPPAVVELGRPDAVQPGGSLQSTPDWLGVPAAPGGSTHLAVPKWRLLPSMQPAKAPSAKGKPSIFGLNRGTPGPSYYLLPGAESGQPPLAPPTLRGKTIVIQRQQPCAVPLTNVLRAFGEPPKVRRIPIPNAHDPMTEVPLPAPSCDDRK